MLDTNDLDQALADLVGELRSQGKRAEAAVVGRARLELARLQQLERVMLEGCLDD